MIKRGNQMRLTIWDSDKEDGLVDFANLQFLLRVQDLKIIKVAKHFVLVQGSAVALNECRGL